MDRYLSGEHEQAWADLVALGSDVFLETWYPDALLVTQELMLRVRHNIEHLIPRLIEIGFVFGYDHLVHEELQILKPLTGANWENYVRPPQWSRKQPPLFLPAHLNDDYRTKMLALDLEDIAGDVLDDEEIGSLPDMPAHVRDLDRLAGPLPLALRVWYEQVGAVNLFGYHSGWVRYIETIPEMP